MTTTLSTRARRALAILTLEAVQGPAALADAHMREVAVAACEAKARAKEAEALADAAPTRAFVAAAESARRTADALEADAQRTYAKFGGVVRRRDAAERELSQLNQLEADAARWTDWVCWQRSLDAARDARLWS